MGTDTLRRGLAVLAVVVAGGLLSAPARGDDGAFVRQVQVRELSWVGADTAPSDTQPFVRQVQVRELGWIGEPSAPTAEPFVRQVQVRELSWEGAQQ